MNRKPFLVVMAMRGEAQPITDRLRLREITRPLGQHLPILGYEGLMPSGRPLVLLLNGVDSRHGVDIIGTQMSAVATVLGIREFQPGHVFNFGTCGALASRGARIGEVYLCSDRVWFHTRRIPMPGWEEHGRGGYSCPEDAPALAAKFGWRSGTLSTTDSLDFPPSDAQQFARNDADIADMEGASIAWMSHLHGLPYYGLKAVTDLMGEDKKTVEQFTENFDRAVAALTEASLKLLEEIDGRD